MDEKEIRESYDADDEETRSVISVDSKSSEINNWLSKLKKCLPELGSWLYEWFIFILLLSVPANHILNRIIAFASIFKSIDNNTIKIWILVKLASEIPSNIFDFFIKFKKSEDKNDNEFTYQNKLSTRFYFVYDILLTPLWLFYIIYYQYLDDNNSLYKLYLSSCYFSFIELILLTISFIYYHY